jgi:hypothetical protein
MRNVPYIYSALKNVIFKKLKSLKISLIIEAIVSLTIGLGFEKLACVYRELRARRMDRGMKVLRMET